MTEPPSSAAALAFDQLQYAAPLMLSDDTYLLSVEDGDYFTAAGPPGPASVQTPPDAPPALTFSLPSTAAQAPVPAPADAAPARVPMLPSSDAAQLIGSGRAKTRRERRGHTKSRRGCLICKRRRIKCGEDKPECSQCRKTGLCCEWLPLAQLAHQPQNQIPLFNLQDMQFFQHVIVQCFPGHPVGAADTTIWTSEIPGLSHKHDFLMHALLGYAAAELAACEDPGLMSPAVTHRLKAIDAMKKVLSRTSPAASSPRSGNPSPMMTPAELDEGNALVATCLTLALQSLFLDDGLVDYMIFLRSILAVATQMSARGGRGGLFFLGAPTAAQEEREATATASTNAHTGDGVLFGLGLDGTEIGDIFNTGDGGVATRAAAAVAGDILLAPDQAGQLWQGIPTPAMATPNSTWRHAALAAVESLDSLCSHPVERTYQELLVKVAQQLCISLWDDTTAQQALAGHYQWWMTIPHDQFQRIIDPSNRVSLLLATHWVALQQIMITTAAEDREHDGSIGSLGSLGSNVNSINAMYQARSPDLFPQLQHHPQHRQYRQQQRPLSPTARTGADIAAGPEDLGVMRWLRHLNRLVDPELLTRNSWPMWVESHM